MTLDLLKREIEHLQKENARLRTALEETEAKLTEPAEIVRAIRQGEIEALVVQQKDQEEIYSLQPFDSMYRTVVEECFPFGVWLAKPDGEILYVTPSFLTLLQTDLQTIRQEGQFHFLPDETRNRVEQEWVECRRTGRPFSVEYTVRISSDSEKSIWTQGLLTQTYDGQTHWVGVNIDVSNRKEMEEALKLADRRKDEFLAMLAHELRNPLAPIRSGLELLKMGEGDEATLAEILTSMEGQVQQLIHLVDDLLDVSRITRGVLNLRRSRVRLSEAIRCAVEATREFIETSGHSLHVTLPDESLHLDADPTRLTQIFSNLLNNAARYTPSGGQIWLFAEREANDAVVKIKDTGIGIPPDQLDSIFDLFAQGDRTMERSQSGLGIGLTLVKSLVEMHNGAITVRSDGSGHGSLFTIRLPLLTGAAATSAPPDAPEHRQAKARSVLVVDDKQDAGKFLAMIIERLGHNVRTASNGEEAITVASAFRPDVVLMDIEMPFMNGYEAARRIRKEPWGRDIYLVALTGWGQENDKRLARDAGFDHHLTKPLDRTVLCNMLENVSEHLETRSR